MTSEDRSGECAVRPRNLDGDAAVVGKSPPDVHGVLTLRSDHLTTSIDLSRGGQLTSVVSRQTGLEALARYEWDAPQPADQGASYGSSTLDWLSKYRGGWQFLFPNAGAEAMVDDVVTSFHGEASMGPVRLIHADDMSCTVAADARLPLELRRSVRLSLDSPTVFIEETVVNVGSKAKPFLWGHHATFPAIPGARIDLPATSFEVERHFSGEIASTRGSWPAAEFQDGRLRDLSVLPTGPAAHLVYLTTLAQGWAALRHPVGSEAADVALAWDLDAYPHLWFWLEIGSNEFPYYGRARVVGLEPQRAWPSDGVTAAAERHQAVLLQPGESTTSWATLSVLKHGGGQVTGVSRDGNVLYAGRRDSD